MAVSRDREEGRLLRAGRKVWYRATIVGIGGAMNRNFKEAAMVGLRRERSTYTQISGCVAD